MFKAEYIVYLWIYINISCICCNNTVNSLFKNIVQNLVSNY